MKRNKLLFYKTCFKMLWANYKTLTIKNDHFLFTTFSTHLQPMLPRSKMLNKVLYHDEKQRGSKVFSDCCVTQIIQQERSQTKTHFSATHFPNATECCKDKMCCNTIVNILQNYNLEFAFVHICHSGNVRATCSASLVLFYMSQLLNLSRMRQNCSRQ